MLYLYLIPNLSSTVCNLKHSSLSVVLSMQVMQVINADAMVVKLNSGEYKTIHLSSIRPPRIEGEVNQFASLYLCVHRFAWSWRFVCECCRVWESLWSYMVSK